MHTVRCFCYGVGVCLLTCNFYIVYWMFRLARGSLVTGKDDRIYLFKKKSDCEFSTQNSKQGLIRNISYILVQKTPNVVMNTL